MQRLNRCYQLPLLGRGYCDVNQLLGMTLNSKVQGS